MIRFRSLKCVPASVDPSFFFDKIILKRSVGILDKNHKNTSIGIGITLLNINNKWALPKIQSLKQGEACAKNASAAYN